MENKDNIIHLCKHCSDERKKEFQKTFNPKIIKKGDFIKKEFRERKKSEHMWVKVVELGKDFIKGYLVNEPNSIKNFKLKDFVKAKFDEIEDYKEVEK